MSAQQLMNEISRLLGWSPQGKNQFLYWKPPKEWQGMRYAFAYTPWKTQYKGQKGYFALKYRILKDGTFKLVKAVRFGRRKVARNRAKKWYDAYYGEENNEQEENE